MVNGTWFFPIRVCRNKADPFELSLITTAIAPSNGSNVMVAVKATAQSKALFVEESDQMSCEGSGSI